jgi:long-chain acyl-CoA synthetase
VYIEDRAKDMILRGGENVYCAEVEAAIYEFPGIHEAAVFGIPDERLGEQVAAVLVPSAGRTIDLSDLTVFLRRRLAAFKLPSQIFVSSDPLPRNAAGKFLKRDLRNRFCAF